MTGIRNDVETAGGSGIFARRYLWATIGSCALVFLGAFEALAVTTIMPLVSQDLDGAALYALAFAGPLAVGVIGMVLAGNLSDRSGPVFPLYASSALFVIGLVLCGTASTMWMLVIGRLVQGLGGGAVTVALYVLVARCYPAALQPRIFAGFAAAWVVPSLIGPYAAAVVAEATNWRWVFLGVVGLVVIATAMVIPATRMLGPDRSGNQMTTRVPIEYGRIIWATLAAAAVLAINVVPAMNSANPQTSPSGLLPVVSVALPIVAIIVVLISLRPLVPPGTLRSARGLPTVILLRGLLSAGFLGAEVYLPYLLIDRYQLAPTLAGLGLTGGAIAWAGASWLQGRLVDRLSSTVVVRIGSALVLVGVLVVCATAALQLPVWLPVLAWFVGGAGMGFIYPRLSVLTLGLSTASNQGFNSSALTISDALGAALALALTGIVFESLAGANDRLAFAGCFAIATLFAIAACSVAGRVGNLTPLTVAPAPGTPD